MALATGWTYVGEDGDAGVALPQYAQKTVYKNGILFISNAKIYYAGSVSNEMPFSLSQHAPVGFTAAQRALAAPFGVPIVSSADAETDYNEIQIAQFDGYSDDADWTSVTYVTEDEKLKGFIDTLVVRTGPLEIGATATITLEVNQATGESLEFTITGEGKRIHTFNVNKECEDFRAFIEWNNDIEEVLVKGVYVYGHMKE